MAKIRPNPPVQPTRADLDRLVEYRPDTGAFHRVHWDVPADLARHLARAKPKIPKSDWFAQVPPSHIVRTVDKEPIVATCHKTGAILVPVSPTRRMYGHTLAWVILYDEWPESTVIHRNGNRRDNRPSNLTLWRPPTEKPRTWRAAVRDGGRVIALGYYATPEEAAEARAMYRIGLFDAWRTDRAIRAEQAARDAAIRAADGPAPVDPS